eukprot:TRINITY_DN13291_c0_g1_i1.p1 TRINITY_DN13291_c0_g1~~TRINITY_DN13291_c0_g1_i1.p1  ORF type:complete len:344 (-),score=86.05 TRINITY_DN13291_c0_g1_i1:22-1053(-)
MDSGVVKATRITLVVLFYWAVSMSLVFMNKWVMKQFNFPYPLFITWVQLLVAEFFILILGFLSPRVGGALSIFAPLEWDWSIAKKIIPLTIVWILMMASSNICLKFTEVTFYQVARALTILWSILFQTFEFPDLVVSNPAKFACFIVFSGFIVGSYGEVNFEWAGWISGVISSMFVAYYNNSIKKSLVFVDNSSWRLMIYNTTWAIFFFIPVLFVTGELVVFDPVATSLLTNEVAQGIVWTGVLGYLINIAIFLQMKMTSPLTGTISGTVKGVLQVLFGWLIFQNAISRTNFLGICLVIGGSSWYSYIQYLKMLDREKAKAEQERKDQEAADNVAAVVVEEEK